MDNIDLSRRIYLTHLQDADFSSPPGLAERVNL